MTLAEKYLYTTSYFYNRNYPTPLEIRERYDSIQLWDKSQKETLYKELTRLKSPYVSYSEVTSLCIFIMESLKIPLDSNESDRLIRFISPSIISNYQEVTHYLTECMEIQNNRLSRQTEYVFDFNDDANPKKSIRLYVNALHNTVRLKVNQFTTGKEVTSLIKHI